MEGPSFLLFIFSFFFWFRDGGERREVIIKYRGAKDSRNSGHFREGVEGCHSVEVGG